MSVSNTKRYNKLKSWSRLIVFRPHCVLCFTPIFVEIMKELKFGDTFFSTSGWEKVKIEKRVTCFTVPGVRTLNSLKHPFKLPKRCITHTRIGAHKHTISFSGIDEEKARTMVLCTLQDQTACAVGDSVFSAIYYFVNPIGNISFTIIITFYSRFLTTK